MTARQLFLYKTIQPGNFMLVTSPDPALVDKLVYANRILYDQGVVDGLGHASVRHPSEPGVFLLSCNVSDP